MKRYLIIVLLLFLITGCNDKKVQQVDKQSQKEVEKKLPIEMEEEQQEVKKEQEQPKQEDIIKEEIKKETKTNIQIKKEETPIKKEEPKEENKEEPPEQEENKEEIKPEEQNNKKIVTCTIIEESTKYIGNVTHTTTFEDNIIIHHKLYIEKSFKEGYLAEEDSWTKDNITSLNNNTKEGITGNIEIKNNITYLTMNYDIKTNPKLIELVTSHTELNDFLNNMNNNGYKCIVK